MSRTPSFSRDRLAEPDLTLPHVATALRTTALFASLLPVVVGAVVLVGWAADVDAL